jgi:hypothetical protein
MEECLSLLLGDIQGNDLKLLSILIDHRYERFVDHKLAMPAGGGKEQYRPDDRQIRLRMDIRDWKEKTAEEQGGK